MKKFTALCLMLLTFMTTAAYASCNVVTLMYHEITENEARWSEWCVPPSTLEEDIKYFTDRGYITITASELANESMENLDGKKILLLTFDDGYYGWYTDAYPVLKRNNAKATMFIVGAYINRYGYLSEAQIHEMGNSGLVEIGNHTDRVHQVPLDVLKSIYNSSSAEDVITDIRNNSKRLSDIVGKTVTSIAWPYGYTTDHLDWRVKNELGYEISFSTNYGVNVYSGDCSILFNRINRELSLTSEELYNRAEENFQQ